MEPNTASGSSHRPLIVVLVVILVVLGCCIVGVGGYFALSSLPGKNSNGSGQVPDTSSSSSGSGNGSNIVWDGSKGVGLAADNFNQTQFNIGTIQRTTQNPSSYNVVNVNVGLPDLSSIKPPKNKDSWVVLNEVFLNEAAFRALAKSGWGKDGNADKSSIHITRDQLGFTSAQYEGMAQVEEIKEQEQVMPDDLKPLYVTDQAAKEIQATLLKAYDEYYQYLKARGVNQKYIDMMKTIVPAKADRVRYIYQGSEGDYASSVHANEVGTSAVDYSQRYMDITAGSLFNDMKYFYNSRVLGDLPKDAAGRFEYQKKLRELIIRQDVYHESTHILQRAYMQVYTPEGDRDEKSIHLFSTKTLATLDQANAWRWTGLTGLTHEEVTRTQEAQAEGISFEVLTNVYHMNNDQRNALWTHIYGRLDPSRDKLFAIKKLFEDNWPSLVNKTGYPDTIAGVVFAGSDSTSVALRKAMRRMDMPSYAGYLDPVTPDRANSFWNAVKE